jgi:hypothetical protein
MLRKHFILQAVAAMVLFGQTAVTTGHYDQGRSGANQMETVLTPQSVNPQYFGRLGTLPVSGCVVSQPLYVPGLNIPGQGTKNVVYVTTSENQVYVFDADDFTLYASRRLADPVPASQIDPDAGFYSFPDCDGMDQLGWVGVTGTPVIDLNEQALYLVAAELDSDTGLQIAMLYKLDLGSLQDLVAPAQIAGQFLDDVFDARYQLQRSALLLASSRVYIAFASHDDERPYRGWLFSYDDQLNQSALYDYSPGKDGSGIWQSGGGPAWDGGNIYVTTGNALDGLDAPSDNVDSILQLDPVTLEVVAKTSFPDEDNYWDSTSDLDLGSSRVILLPGTPFAVSGSKYGDMFVLRRSDMSLVTRFQAAARHSSGFDWTGIYNGFAYWNNTLYVWPGGGGADFDTVFPTDVLKAYSVSPDGSVKQVAAGQTDGVGVGYQGAGLAISSNLNDPASGIVWALTPTDNNGWLRPGVLRAYAASSTGVFQQLWSDADPVTGNGGYYLSRLSQPLIANGRVYVPTFSSQVVVYGVLPQASGLPSIHPPEGSPASECRWRPESASTSGSPLPQSSCAPAGSSPR